MLRDQMRLGAGWCGCGVGLSTHVACATALICCATQVLRYQMEYGGGEAANVPCPCYTTDVLRNSGA